MMLRNLGILCATVASAVLAVGLAEGSPNAPSGIAVQWTMIALLLIAVPAEMSNAIDAIGVPERLALKPRFWPIVAGLVLGGGMGFTEFAPHALVFGFAGGAFLVIALFVREFGPRFCHAVSR